MENTTPNDNPMNDNSPETTADAQAGADVQTNADVQTGADVQADALAEIGAVAEISAIAESALAPNAGAQANAEVPANDDVQANPDVQANADAAEAADAGNAPEEAAAPQGDVTQSAAQVEAPSIQDTSTQAAPASSSGKQPSMEQLMSMDEFMAGADSLQRGALLRGIVVRVDENTGEALVDIGTKSEGIVTRNEMGGDDVNVGDEIEVVVLRPEDDEGHPVLSKRRADYEKTWRVIQQAKDKGTNLEGTVREQVKGGLIVDLGVSAFVPASHVDARNRGDLSRFVGRTIPVRVIEIDRKRDKVIASHRIAAAEDREKREAEVWGKLQKDEVVEGIVRRITDFGAFIDIGGVDGLLHVREMAWGRVEHPEHVVKKGQKLQVMVLDIDEEKKRVALGLKQLQSDPWKKASKNFRVGQMLNGKIVRIAPTCAFVELEDGVEGIIPIGEMSETRINTPEDVLEVGQDVEARVKQIQSGQRRITLSLKAAVQERETRETRANIREVNERATGGEGGGSGGGVSLGDLFGQQLRAMRDTARDRRDRTASDARKEAKQRALQAAEEEEDYNYEDDEE